MTENHTCCHCGQTIAGIPIWVNEDTLCERCAEEETILCSHCGERIYRNDNAGDENTPLCQSCYDRYYLSCDRCGCIIHEDDAYYPLCLYRFRNGVYLYASTEAILNRALCQLHLPWGKPQRVELECCSLVWLFAGEY